MFETKSNVAQQDTVQNQYLHLTIPLPLVDGAMECCCSRYSKLVGFFYFSWFFRKERFETYSCYGNGIYQLSWRKKCKMSVFQLPETEIRVLDFKRISD